MRVTSTDSDDTVGCDVFISYASQDAASADAVCVGLERRGLRCWIAPRDVMPGTLYADAIVRALNTAKIFVLLLSQHAVGSAHVGKEVERASSKQRPILALRMDAASLTPALEYFLSGSQWVDVSPGGLEAALTKVAEAIRALLAVPGAGASSEAAPNATEAGAAETVSKAIVSAGRRRRRRWAIAASIAIIGFGCVLVVAKHWFASPAPGNMFAGDPAKSNDRSVAVLPFEDLSEKKDQAYFSDGLSSELIDLLAKIPGLRVPARVSSFYFKGKQATLPEIAHALNVAHLLEGTVRTSGQNVRITADLVNVGSGSPIWSQTYDRKLEDIFKIQDEIADSVVGALKVSLLGAAPPRATPTANTAAYTAYLKCQESSAETATREGRSAAVAECQQAVDLDPNYAPAWVTLADSLRTQFVAFGDGNIEVARARVVNAIERALALDPRSAAAHQGLAVALYQLDFDPAAAELEVQKAVAIDPTVPGLDWLKGYIASVQCRFEDALRAFADERARNPLAIDTPLQVGNTYYRSGDLDAARNAYLSVLALRPVTGSVHYRLGLVSLLRHDPATALAEFEHEPDPDFHATGLPIAYDAMGRKAEADQALAAAEQIAANGASYQVALAYAARGDIEKTFVWLDRAYAQHDAGMLWIKGEPFLKNLHADARFQTLLHKMHLD